MQRRRVIDEWRLHRTALRWLPLLALACGPPVLTKRTSGARPSTTTTPQQATLAVFGRACGAQSTVIEAVLDGDNVLLGHQTSYSWTGSDHYQVIDVATGTVRAEFPHRARTVSASADGRRILMTHCVHDDGFGMAKDDCLWDLSSEQIEIVPRESVENLYDGNALTVNGKTARHWTSGQATPHGFVLWSRWDEPSTRIYDRKGSLVVEAQMSKDGPRALHGKGTRLARLVDGLRVEVLSIPSLAPLHTVRLPSPIHGCSSLAYHGDTLSVQCGDDYVDIDKYGKVSCSSPKGPRAFSDGTKLGPRVWSIGGERWAAHHESKEGWRVAIGSVAKCAVLHERVLDVTSAESSAWSPDLAYLATTRLDDGQAKLRIDHLLDGKSHEVVLGACSYPHSRFEGPLKEKWVGDHKTDAVPLPLAGVPPWRSDDTRDSACGGRIRRMQPDGSLGDAASGQGPVIIVEPDGTRVVLEDYEGPMLDVVTSRGARLVSFHDRTWDCKTGQVVAKRHIRDSGSLDSAADGRFLITHECVDGTKVTIMPTPAPIEGRDVMGTLPPDEPGKRCGLVVWDTETEARNLFPYGPHFSLFGGFDVAKSDSGMLLLSFVGLYDPVAKKVVWEENAFVDAFAPDGRHAVISGKETSLVDLATKTRRPFVASARRHFLWTRTHVLVERDENRWHAYDRTTGARTAHVGTARFLAFGFDEHVAVFSQGMRVTYVRLADGKRMYQYHRYDGGPLTVTEEGRFYGDDSAVAALVQRRPKGSVFASPITRVEPSHPMRLREDPMPAFGAGE